MKMKIMQVSVVVGLMSLPCISQEIGLVSGEIDGWAYLPVMVGMEVDKIIALRLEPSASPVNALWCWEDANGEWQAEAWEGAAWEEVAAFTFDYIGYQAGDPEVEDDLFLWPVELDIAIVNQALDSSVQEPQPFGDGVFIGDALEPVIQSNPDVLEPLETIGYAAVASMSGAAITQGTFGGVGIDPQPRDDDCIALIDLLNALTLAFETSQDDWNLVDQAFIMYYEDNASDGSGCTCPTRTWTVSISGWTYICDPWIQVRGPYTPAGFPQECRWDWERQVHGTQTRLRAHTGPHPITGNCVSETCTQTRFKTDIQERTTLTPRGINQACPPSGPLPAAGTPCTGGGSAGPWVPATCPWQY